MRMLCCFGRLLLRTKTILVVVQLNVAQNQTPFVEIRVREILHPICLCVREFCSRLAVCEWVIWVWVLGETIFLRRSRCTLLYRMPQIFNLPDLPDKALQHPYFTKKYPAVFIICQVVRYSRPLKIRHIGLPLKIIQPFERTAFLWNPQ